MFALQQLALQRTPRTAAQDTRMCELRDKIPLEVLGHFNRMIERGQKGVALVRHGVCSECHLRVSSGTVASLVQPKDIYICDNCGRYLLLPLEEIAPPAAAPSSAPLAASPKRKARKKPVAVAV
jgi:predicted  nucleic acid-binding Zn-ribbon protein